MRRVLFFVREYPQISETYIRTEIDRVKRRFAVSVACLQRANLAYDGHEPYELLSELSEHSLSELAERHKPDIIHGHYFKFSRALVVLAPREPPRYAI